MESSLACLPLLADILALKGNPVDDIALVQHVRFIVKDGTVYQQQN